MARKIAIFRAVATHMTFGVEHKRTVPWCRSPPLHPAFLWWDKDRHSSGADTSQRATQRPLSRARSGTGATRSRKASMARTHPLTAGGRGVDMLFVGCGPCAGGAFPPAADAAEQSRLLLV